MLQLGNSSVQKYPPRFSSAYVVHTELQS